MFFTGGGFVTQPKRNALEIARSRRMVQEIDHDLSFVSIDALLIVWEGMRKRHWLAHRTHGQMPQSSVHEQLLASQELQSPSPQKPEQPQSSVQPSMNSLHSASHVPLPQEFMQHVPMQSCAQLHESSPTPQVPLGHVST